MPKKKGQRRILVPVYLDPGQKQAIDALSKSTRVPVAVYLREAVDGLLKKYGKRSVLTRRS